MHVWLFKPGLNNVATVRIDSPDHRSGTVLARAPDGSYFAHRPHHAIAARCVLLDVTADGQGRAVMRDATLIGSLLTQGRGIDETTAFDLRVAGFKVIP